MKKYLISIAALLTLSATNLSCFADELNLKEEAQYQKKVMEIGFRVLNANKIDKRIVFRYSNSKIVNAYACPADKSVNVEKGILPYFDNDDELAAIISHEIAHNVDFHAGYMRGFAMMLSPKKYETKADIKAIDYMVKAGYDPVAAIIVATKLFEEPGWVRLTFLNDHPRGSKRQADMYEYIYKKYPVFLVDNQYKTNLYYQNFLLTSQKDREKIRNRQIENIIDKREKQEKM